MTRDPEKMERRLLRFENKARAQARYRVLKQHALENLKNEPTKERIGHYSNYTLRKTLQDKRKESNNI
jgi:hypothetical protein